MKVLVSWSRGIPVVAAVATAVMVSALGATAARAAAPDYAIAHNNPDPQAVSSFTLDFGDFGGETQAIISETDIVMRYEFAAQNGTSRFLDYDQNVDSLTLPGGLETGAIRIEILESENVSFEFDPNTGIGEFVTNDVYAVHFEGEIGIESPFVMPASSNGQIIFDGDDHGRIEMQWEGEGLLGDDPQTAIPFFYTCLIRTVFSIAEQGDFDGDSRIGLVDFGFFQLCYSGNDQAYPDGVCEMADFDRDGDVDEIDYPVFHGLAAGE